MRLLLGEERHMSSRQNNGVMISIRGLEGIQGALMASARAEFKFDLHLDIHALFFMMTAGIKAGIYNVVQQHRTGRMPLHTVIAVI